MHACILHLSMYMVYDVSISMFVCLPVCMHVSGLSVHLNLCVCVSFVSVCVFVVVIFVYVCG